MNQLQIDKSENTKPGATFIGLGIDRRLFDALDRLGYKIPTPIQNQAIPLSIQGKDIIGIAQTGTGKTLAFSVPLIQSVIQKTKNGKGLIILPTRELAMQVEETLSKIGRAFGLKTATLIGGVPIYRQIRMIRNNPHIIIGTPGRINDHIHQKTLNLNNVDILVLDEADRMLDMGFAPQINKILQVVPKNRQTMLFSATIPDSIAKIASNYMKLPVRIEIAKSGTMAEKIEHQLFFVSKNQKSALLKSLLSEYNGSVLIFIRVKHGAKKVCNFLKETGISAAEIHSNRSLGQRKEALQGFKSGKYRVLTATDIASRGIDVKNIELVVNYDLPENAEDYVHRIGRTGRAGMKGKAISFAMPDQKPKIREIEKLTKINLPISRLPGNLPISKLECDYTNNFRPNKKRWRGYRRKNFRVN
ncbi:MAG: hypothetical protein A2427_00625 [Candidatus Nealsonbacteria bacterium RIFOXYC1_FULL_40_7]|uniref:DEAD/DEAH box helicase n=1 Tax=Candidatus Nealsonbacteria bacterium RIFOXYC1_FULL_40_7 TaxID=1801678 RepID=A0A1G2ENF2_9BACT|nr:MAG: hypothetical protein A2427_00625 [Candidatus Nealsonbacteria bacterium RIFOXYC1_FULL_40_7]